MVLDSDDLYPFHDPTDTSWKEHSGDYKSGHEVENPEDFFNYFEKFLKNRFKNDKDHLRRIVDALGKGVENLSDINSGDRHQKSLSEVFGNGKAGEVLGLLGQSQGEYLKKHKGFKEINLPLSFA